MTTKEEKLVQLASKGGNDSDLLLLDDLNSLEEKVDKLEQKTEKDIENLDSKLDSAIKEVKDEIKESIPDLDKVLESVRGTQGIQGEKGDVGSEPSDERLVELITPLIPDPIPGEDGRDGKSIIGPPGPKGERGESVIGPPGPAGKDGSPDKPEQIADKLNLLEEAVDQDVIKGLKDEIKTLKSDITKAANRQIGGFKALRAATFSFSGTGAATSFSLPKVPGAKGKAIWAFYQGQYLQQGVHFTVSNKTFNTLGGTSPFTAESGTVIEGFIFLF